MQTSPYKAYRLAQARMDDAHREAERWRLAQSVRQQSPSCGLLQRLGLRRKALTPLRPDAEAGETRPVPRRAATTATR